MTKPRILWVHRQNSAVGAYRTWYPARELTRRGYEIRFWEGKPALAQMKPMPSEWLRANIGKFDLLITDRLTDYEDLPILLGFRHASKDCRMIVDFDDDWMKVPRWNQSFAKYLPGQVPFEVGRMHLKGAELTSVSTETLRERFTPFSHEIVTCPNGIDPSDWEKFSCNPNRAKDPRVRVFYGGASGHFGDLDETRLGIETVLQNPPVPMRLICFGALPHWIHELARKYPDRVVRLPWTNFSDYPSSIAWGGFDFAIAPLAKHPFNEAKSNIKWQEASIQKIPLLCSDVGPYANEVPAGAAVKVANTPVQWAEAFRALLQDKDLRAKIRKTAYEAVKSEWTVDKTVKAWEICIEKAMSRPRIETLEDTRLSSEPSPTPES